MSIVNGYITLAEYKAYVTAAGQTMSSDTADDTIIENLVNSACRYIDGQTQRRFYPSVETRLYDIPEDTNDNRVLMLDDDLLSAITFLNGDAVEITSSDYKLLPYNVAPKYAIRLKDTSDVTWETDTSASGEGVLSVTGFWGYHDFFAARAWASVGTIAAAMDSDTASITMTSGHSVAQDDIIKIDNEIMLVSSVSSNTVTPQKRGDNGSTAAAHVILSTVNAWRVMDEIKQATFEIVNNAYRRRFGQNLSGQTMTTPAGLVISPADVTETARKTMNRLGRIL